MKKKAGKKTKEKEIDNFIYKNLKLGLNFLNISRNYVFFSFLLFLIMGSIGFSFPIFFEKEVLKLIQEIVEKTSGLGGLGLIRFIITNNMWSGFVGMILGILFGIIPLVVIIVNGYVLGFIAIKTVSLTGGISILWRLLPHGVFEIPAIMISVGLGLKLGSFLFVKHKDYKNDFLDWIKNSLRAFIFVVIPLLVIAGIIEGLLIVLLG